MRIKLLKYLARILKVKAKIIPMKDNFKEERECISNGIKIINLGIKD